MDQQTSASFQSAQESMGKSLLTGRGLKMASLTSNKASSLEEREQDNGRNQRRYGAARRVLQEQLETHPVRTKAYAQGSAILDRGAEDQCLDQLQAQGVITIHH